jgi:hypothetical protein
MIVLNLRAAHVLLHILCKQSPTDDVARALSYIVADHDAMLPCEFEAALAAIFIRIDADTYNRAAAKLKKINCTGGNWCTCPQCLVGLAMCDLSI